MVYTMHAQFTVEAALIENLRIVTGGHADDLDGEKKWLLDFAQRLNENEQKVMRLDTGVQNLEK